MKGIVVAHNKSKTIVLTKDGRVLEKSIKPRPMLGEEVSFNKGISIWMRSLAAMLVLSLSLGAFLWANWPDKVQASELVELDFCPGLSLEIDGANQVIAIHTDTDQAKSLTKELTLRELPVSDAVVLLTMAAVERGLLTISEEEIAKGVPIAVVTTIDERLEQEPPVNDGASIQTSQSSESWLDETVQKLGEKNLNVHLYSATVSQVERNKLIEQGSSSFNHLIQKELQKRGVPVNKDIGQKSFSEMIRDEELGDDILHEVFSRFDNQINKQKKSLKEEKKGKGKPDGINKGASKQKPREIEEHIKQRLQREIITRSNNGGRSNGKQGFTKDSIGRQLFKKELLKKELFKKEFLKNLKRFGKARQSKSKAQ